MHHHHDAAHSRELPSAFELLESQFGLLHKQHGEPDEAVGISAMRRRAGVIVALGKLEPERRRRPVDHRSHERQHLRVDAGLVHGFDAAFEIDVVGAEHGPDPAGVEGDAATVVAADAGSGGFSFGLDQVHPLDGVPVGVRVDHTPAGLAGCVDAAEHDPAARRRGADQEIALGHRHGFRSRETFLFAHAGAAHKRRGKPDPFRRRDRCDAARACQAAQIC